MLQPIDDGRKGLWRLAQVAPRIRQPLPAWGARVRAGSPYLRLYPHLAVFPGLLIMLAVLGFNAMGDAIRDILNPRMLNRVRGGRTT